MPDGIGSFSAGSGSGGGRAIGIEFAGSLGPPRSALRSSPVARSRCSWRVGGRWPAGPVAGVDCQSCLDPISPRVGHPSGAADDAGRPRRWGRAGRGGPPAARGCRAQAGRRAQGRARTSARLAAAARPAGRPWPGRAQSCAAPWSSPSCRPAPCAPGQNGPVPAPVRQAGRRREWLLQLGPSTFGVSPAWHPPACRGSRSGVCSGGNSGHWSRQGGSRSRTTCAQT